MTKPVDPKFVEVTCHRVGREWVAKVKGDRRKPRPVGRGRSALAAIVDLKAK